MDGNGIAFLKELPLQSSLVARKVPSKYWCALSSKRGNNSRPGESTDQLVITTSCIQYHL